MSKLMPNYSNYHIKNYPRVSTFGISYKNDYNTNHISFSNSRNKDSFYQNSKTVSSHPPFALILFEIILLFNYLIV
jgi:hypothetical protein